MQKDFNNILIDFSQLQKDWKEKEKQLIESEEYQTADKMDKEEMLYDFDCSQNEAITEAMRQSNLQVSRIKGAFHLLMNYCNSRSGDCSDCILCDLSKSYEDDTKCLLDKFQYLTNAQLDNQIEENVRKLQHKINSIIK